MVPGRGDSGASLWEGENEVTNNFWALPGLNKLQAAAEESTSTNFRYYSEFGQNLLHHLRIEFPVVKY